MTKTNKIKTALLTTAIVLGLAVGYTATAQDKQQAVETFNRASYKAACIKGAPADVDQRVIKAICECAVQYISYESNNGELFGDFSVPATEPIVALAVPACVELGQIVGPESFFEAFESTEAGARASE